MKILFLHPNFPAQFRHISRHFAEEGSDVMFLCQTHYGRSIPGVKRMTLKDKKKEKCFDNLYTHEFSRSKARSNLYRSAFLQLRDQQKWNPDIVISHSGWGCGLHVKEIGQNNSITYLEWWFNPNSESFIKKGIKICIIAQNQSKKCG